MPEEQGPNLELIDTSAQFRPEKIDNTGAFDIEDLSWNEGQREELWRLTEQFYEDLATEANDIFEIQMPKFQREMIKWVKFNYKDGHHNNRAADLHPDSGLMRMSPSAINDELDALRFMAHEMVHFAARRKLFTKDDTSIPARVGISLIGNPVAKRGEDPKDLVLERYNGSSFNEALTEIVSAEMVNRVKDKYDFIPEEGITPRAYANERRLFSAVVDATVFSWNNPETRQELFTNDYNEGVKDHSLKMDFQPGYRERRQESWRNRIERLKERLGWGEKIDKSQVEQLFIDAIKTDDGLTKIAPLLNTCLGEQAFQSLWEARAGERNDYAWRLLRPFSEYVAFQAKDISVTLGDLELLVKAEEIPEEVIVSTYEEVDGTQLGLEDIFREYEKQIEHPISKEDLLLYADRSHRLRQHRGGDYPFDYPIVHEQTEKSTLFTRKSDTTMDYCFEKLSKTIGLKDQPSSTDSREVLGTTYETEYYECEHRPDVYLSKVTMRIPDAIRELKYTRYFFVSKN